LEKSLSTTAGATVSEKLITVARWCLIGHCVAESRELTRHLAPSLLTRVHPTPVLMGTLKAASGCARCRKVESWHLQGWENLLPTHFDADLDGASACSAYRRLIVLPALPNPMRLADYCQGASAASCQGKKANNGGISHIAIQMSP
jgi:hypothetical protein